MVKHLLDLTELSREEALRIMELTQDAKSRRREELLSLCAGKRAALIFEKPSTRTRVSLEVAVGMLGAQPIVLSIGEMQISRGEDLKDTARVLSRYVDSICARVHSHESLVEMSKYSSVPVVNALSDMHHPLQALADVYTLYEKTGNFDFKLAYIGDGNNVCHSLIIASSLFGFKLRVSTPPGYEPNEKVVETALKIQEGCYEYYADPYEAVKGATAVYTDTWVSMGFDAEREKRLSDFRNWKVTKELLDSSGGAYFMHCLPAHKGEEVEEEVFESPASIVFEQAENRLYTSAGVFLYLWREVRG